MTSETQSNIYDERFRKNSERLLFSQITPSQMFNLILNKLP